MPPLLPHAAMPVPGSHVPPVAAEQHPPLHGWPVLQLVVHWCLVPSHAMPAGQSAAEVHPAPPSVPPSDAAPVSAPPSGDASFFGPSPVASAPASACGPPSNGFVASGMPASNFSPLPLDDGPKHPTSAAPSTTHTATAHRPCLAPIGPT